MALAGADLEQLDQLRSHLEREAGRLDGLTRRISGEVAQLDRLWMGADAAGFVQAWQRTHRPQLARAVQEVRDAADTVSRNRDAQQATSEADGGESSSGWGIPGAGLFNSSLPGLDWLGDRADDVGDGLDWLGDRGEEGVDWLGDRAQDGVDWFDDRVDDAQDGIDWLGDQAGALWDDATDRASDLWNDFKERAINAAGDVAISTLLTHSRALKLAFNYAGIPIAAVGTALFGPLVGPALGLGYDRLVAPTIRDWWNREVTPQTVGDLFGVLEGRVGGDEVPTGDLEAREFGGAFPVRQSDPTGADPTLPQPFEVSGDTPSEVGRNAVVRALQDTANSDQIYADEFEVVDHGNGHYTVVLPGVTDLSSPNQGLNEAHRSVRDTDFAAAASAASADIDDNAYAQMVRDYVEQNVPPGSSLAIVGHSFGGDTALDLAADPNFNGRDYNVTHVVAAAYHSEPQLAHVQDGTEVLVLQNTRDIPVVVEELGHASGPGEIFPRPPEGTIVEEFTGGWKGAGHHQDNYIEHVEQGGGDEVDAFFAGWAESGYGDQGEVTAVDVSVRDEGGS